MPYTPILGTLGYVLSPDGLQVLMIHRNRNPNDYHFGKYNGLGGKLESGEEIVTGMRREIREEAGIECEELTLRGTISWPGFGKHGEDWFGFVFVISRWSGTLLRENPEGTLVWVPREQVLELNLWEGDRLFYPLIFDPQISSFHGVMPYENGKPKSWSVTTI
jgi:8-oxo-dGTP diphosphatase